MPVRFVCSCGQVLRAAEGLPDYAVVCPVCGSPVGGATPLPSNPAAKNKSLPRPEESFSERPQPARKARVRPEPGEPPEDVGHDPAVEVPKRTLTEDEATQVRRWLGAARKELSRKRDDYRAWGRETRWYHCLFYPVRALPCVLLLAAVWATFTPLLPFLMPQGLDAVDLLPWLPVAGIFLLLLAYTAAFLGSILAAATGGEAGFIPWPGRDLPTIARAGGISLACFLAGPVVPAVVGFLFWLHSGDLAPIDVLILVELALLALGAWAVLTLTVWHSSRLGDAGPAGIVRLWQRRGFLPIGAGLLAAVLVLGHCWLVLGALDLFQRRPPPGWLLLVLEWAGCLSLLVLLLRWLGLVMFWRARAQKKRKLSRAEEEAARQRAEEDLAADVLLGRDVPATGIQDLGSGRPPGAASLRAWPE